MHDIGIDHVIFAVSAAILKLAEGRLEVEQCISCFQVMAHTVDSREPNLEKLYKCLFSQGPLLNDVRSHTGNHLN